MIKLMVLISTENMFWAFYEIPQKYYSERNTGATKKIAERAARNQMWIVLQT